MQRYVWFMNYPPGWTKLTNSADVTNSAAKRDHDPNPLGLAPDPARIEEILRSLSDMGAGECLADAQGPSAARQGPEPGVSRRVDERGLQRKARAHHRFLSTPLAG